jgi:hypothetical protein
VKAAVAASFPLIVSMNISSWECSDCSTSKCNIRHKASGADRDAAGPTIVMWVTIILCAFVPMGILARWACKQKPPLVLPPQKPPLNPKNADTGHADSPVQVDDIEAAIQADDQDC